MSDPDNNGQDGLTLCEAWRLSPPTECLVDAVSRRFDMPKSDAIARIFCGFVSINGNAEKRTGYPVSSGDFVTVQPDPAGAEWDALRAALRPLLETLSDSELIGLEGDFSQSLLLVTQIERLSEIRRRGEH